MTQIVVMPGGFHPFHAGHMALYNSAREDFPDAEVYVAATNDTSSRPFPFAVKEKLAKLAGVEPGHFVQVKSPFRAEEITAKFDPAQDTLIFVRSQKDAGSPPQPGGTKKDGSPAYLQPLAGAESLEPFAKHAYMAYLPTVEFAGGMKSASEIRAEWPSLDDQGKLDRVMSLYPAAQKNPKLAAVVVKLLDAAIGSEQGVAENQGWAATYETNTQNFVGGMKAGYQARENQPVDEDRRGNLEGDPELKQAKLFAKQHYPEFAGDEEIAFDKWVQRSLHHSEEEDAKHSAAIRRLSAKITDLQQQLQKAKSAFVQEDLDYIEEKWSQKYKSSINCANPKGFSQRAHCAGRKK